MKPRVKKKGVRNGNVACWDKCEIVIKTTYITQMNVYFASSFEKNICSKVGGKNICLHFKNYLFVSDIGIQSIIFLYKWSFYSHQMVDFKYLI